MRKAISCRSIAKVASIGEVHAHRPPHGFGPAGEQGFPRSNVRQPDLQGTPQAAQLLTNAGFKKGSDGILVGPDGKKFTITIDGVSGYTDWDTDYQIIADDLKPLGIQVNITDNQPDAVQQDMEEGNFEMAIWYETPGPTPYYIYNALWQQFPRRSARAPQEFRASDKATDDLLTQYNSTADVAAETSYTSRRSPSSRSRRSSGRRSYWYEYNTIKYDGCGQIRAICTPSRRRTCIDAEFCCSTCTNSRSR